MVNDQRVQERTSRDATDPRPGGPAAGAGRTWFLAGLVLLAYALSQACLIARHSALPIHDQANYVGKTYFFAEAVASRPFASLLKPSLYLREAPYAARPPLFPAASAWLLGREPSPASIALSWLAFKLVLLAFALYVLSRALGDVGFVLPSLLAILAESLNWDVDQLYLMDVPLGMCCLTAFAFLVLDDRRQRAWTALVAAAALFLPFLIKPIAPLVLLPLCIVRAARALLPVLRTVAVESPGAGEHAATAPDRSRARRLAAMGPWAVPWLLLPLAYVATYYGTSYGAAAKAHLSWANEGYWRTSLDWSTATTMASHAVPPWVLLLFLAASPFLRGARNPWLLVYAGCGVVSLLAVYLLLITQAYDPRYAFAILPTATAALLAYLCQRRGVRWLATAVASACFLASFGVSTGRLSARAERVVARSLGRLSPLPQPARPLPESGFLPFAGKAAELVPPGEKSPVLLTTIDAYIDLGTAWMSQALDRRVADRVEWRVPRLGSRNFDLGEYLGPRWVVTRGRRSRYFADEATMASIDALQDLVASPESPLRDAFVRRLEMPVMSWLESPPADTLSLYERVRLLTRHDFIAALRWVEPRFRDFPGHAELLGRIRELERPTRLLALPFSSDAGPEYCRPRRERVALAGDAREALLQHPPPGDHASEFVLHDVSVSRERPRLRFGVGLSSATWDPKYGDGVEFSLDVVAGGRRRTLFRQYIDPKRLQSDRRWHDHVVDLAAFAGETVSIVLRTHPGPKGDNSHDHAFWSGLEFVAPDVATDGERPPRSSETP
jgi:hypothetical protein